MSRIRSVRGRATFEALARAHRWRRGPVGLRFVAGGPAPGVAYAVGRAAGTAVARNRIRRRLAHAVAPAAHRMEPGSYLFTASREALTMPFAELRRCVAELLALAAARG